VARTTSRRPRWQGIQPADIFAPGTSSIDAGLGLNGSSLLMTSSSLVGASTNASATNIDSLLADGGWVSDSSYGEVVAGGHAGHALE
jgi:hypothetical protein